MGQTNEDRHETFEPLKKFFTSKLFQNKSWSIYNFTEIQKRSCDVVEKIPTKTQ